MSGTARELTRRRCPICQASWWLTHRDGAECSHCRLIVCESAVLPLVADDLGRRLASGRLAFADRPGNWWTDDAGARNLAWRYGYRVRSLVRRIRPGDRPARLDILPSEPVEHRVALAMIARADDPRAYRTMQRLAPAFRRRIVLLDGDDAARDQTRFAGAIIAAHPLAGDFAAQRNRLQAMAGEGWVLQIDSDEAPDPTLIAALGWLTAEADRDGLRSLGIARRNHVDGRLSALYPDIQYRLNRADVRFANRVHERPVVPFEQTSLALAGAIDHHLTGTRVRERTQIYERMSDGAGRPEDEALLLRRFDPIAL